MAVKYADRAFITLNGQAIQDIQSASLKQNRNARAVPSMTRGRFNKGFVQGNTDIDITLSIAVQNQLARPKLDQIDYENNDVGIVWECGQERFQTRGVFLKDTEDNSGGVGDEVKATFNMGALELVDPVGNSSLFDLVLSSG